MTDPIESGVTMPTHACNSIQDVLRQDAENVAAAVRMGETMVRQGSITQAKHEQGVRVLREAGPEMAAFCAGYCNVGRCAMKGFGKELVGANPEYMSDEDRARAEFYGAVDVTRYVSEMRLGVNL